MKTNKLIAAALLPLLFSCAKENLNQIDKPENGGKYDFTINLIPSDDAVTRAFFSDENGIYWDTAEHSGGIIDKDNNKYQTTSVKIYPWENGDSYKNQASFQFFETYSGNYKLFYPYDENATYDNIAFWVDPKQYSGVGASKDIFSLVSDGEVDLTDENHDTGATCKYKIVGSYIRFAVYGGQENTQIKSISVKSSNAKIHGNFYVDGTDNSLKGINNNGEDLLIDLLGEHCPAGTSKDNAKGIYASILPTIEGTNPKSKNEYVVATDKGFYTFQSSKEREFAFGSIKQINLNLDKATSYSKTPENLYIIGGATPAQWHAANAIELSKVAGTNKFEIKDIKLNAGEGDSGFKFLTKLDSWNKVYVNGMNNNKTITYYEDPGKAGNDTKFFVTESGHYNVLVDFDKNEVTCTKLVPEVYTYPEGSEVKVNMSFSEKEDVYKAVIYLAEGDVKHDFKINYNNQFYHVDRDGYQEVNFSTGENKHTVGYDWAVVADNKDKGWWVYNEYCNKYYEVTLDLTNNKVSLKLAQGKNFWLIGAPFGGWPDPNNPTKNDTYKGTVDDSNGVVTWEVTTEQTGDFKICGENTLENNFWGGEWYYSTGSNGFDWSWVEGNNYSTDSKPNPFNVLIFNVGADNNKWKLNETGKFKIVFDTKNLTIQVYKNSLVSRQMAL